MKNWNEEMVLKKNKEWKSERRIKREKKYDYEIKNIQREKVE